MCVFRYHSFECNHKTLLTTDRNGDDLTTNHPKSCLLCEYLLLRCFVVPLSVV